MDGAVAIAPRRAFTLGVEAVKRRVLDRIVVWESTLGESRQVVSTAPELVVIRAGSVAISPGPSAGAATGDLILMPAATSLRRGPGVTVRSTHFQLSAALVERLAGFLPATAEVFRAERFGDAVSRMMAEKRGADAASALALEAAVLQIVAQARRIRSSITSMDGRYSREIAAAVDYAREHLDQVITLDALARAAGMSLRGLSHRFGVELNTSPLAYVRELRLREAERLLRDSSLGIAEIAHRCGFYDHAHLTRTFREHLASTPADYRRSLRNRSAT